jgi:hypothetical protein
LPPTFYRGCWHVVSRDLFLRYRPSSSRRKGLYNPKTVFTHAASLRQGFPHCAISLTAASRRSLGRVSVPVWGVILSDPRPVVGLVGFYPTNYLMGRSPLPRRLISRRSFLSTPTLPGISGAFAPLSPSRGQVSYVLLTRAPLFSRTVRLACVRHAASVHPEPGSNSPFVSFLHRTLLLLRCKTRGSFPPRVHLQG